MYQVTEFGRLIDFSVRKEILSSCLSFLQGEEDGLHHICDIDKGNILTLETYGKVKMILDTLDLQEIVTLTRTIDSRGS